MVSNHTVRERGLVSDHTRCGSRGIWLPSLRGTWAGSHLCVIAQVGSVREWVSEWWCLWVLGPMGPSKIDEVTLMRPIHGNL